METTLIILLLLCSAVSVWAWRRAVSQSARLEVELHSLRERGRLASHEMEFQRKTLFDHMVEGVALLDAGRRVQLANEPFQHLFGFPSNHGGLPLLECARNLELADLIADVFTNKAARGREFKLDGDQERWVRINAAPILDQNKNVSVVVVVAHDLTELKRLGRNREEFVANVSHELRTPLSLIKGCAETLLDGAKDNPEATEKFLTSIDRNAERLHLLIEDLLTISELESGRVRLEIQPVSLMTVANRVCEDFQSRAESSGVRLSVIIPDILAMADQNRLQQVLGNLVDNAIKYGRKDGSVKLSARTDAQGWIEVCVADDGAGIPAEAQARVFERFYRVAKSRSREQGGTGLGLSIVKHIIQSHGGRVWVESAPGQGCRFFFTLPTASSFSAI